MENKTNQEKSRVIAEKFPELCGHYKRIIVNSVSLCADCSDKDLSKNGSMVCVLDPIDFFTPEGQAVLAGALLEDSDLMHNFGCWLESYGSKDERYKEYWDYFKIIAETKLAQLFYEFIESEGEDG